MDFRKQIKDIDVDVSTRCRQLDEIRTECSASEMGVSVLSATMSVSRDYRKTRRNNNILIFDDREDFYKIEMNNLKDDKSNYIIVDFDGEYYNKTAADFRQRGYVVKNINLVDPPLSDGYNPFAYIQNEVDVDVIVGCIMGNTRSKYSMSLSGSDKELVDALERSFLRVLLSAYMKYGTSKTLTAVANMLRNENREAKLDKLFSGDFPQGPTDVECRRYKMIKRDAGIRFYSILQSCSERISFFKDERLTTLTKKQSISFEHLYQAKQVLYIVIPSTLKEVELFTSLILSQITYILCNESRKNNNDRMVMLYLNYFADAGAISNFDRLLPVIQQYNIGCMLHVNNLARVAQVYSKWESLFSSCDTILYLCSNDSDIHKYVFEHSDPTLIRKKKILGKEVYTNSQFKMEEIKNLGARDSICVVKGIGTFLLPKIDAYDEL